MRIGREKTLPNHLEGQMSPYLLQHADNPVSWYPWCEEAFRKAQTEDKPIFLSIGYSTCHWCHVMARESFENDTIADILNQSFISIKVDREERPDIDSVYMAVCQAFTGSGGWPMSIFMTWDKQPFFAGTYYPAKGKYGMSGFADLLLQIREWWQMGRAALLRSAKQLMQHVQPNASASTSGDTSRLVSDAADDFKESFDPIYGGFGAAPKFPTPHNLLFLLYYSNVTQNQIYRQMVETTLLQMRKGGIFDQIGFGFSRYSTDRFFLAPHFEKMLYDNALLMIAYTAAYHVTKQEVYLRTAEETADYILREMTSPDGAVYSAQDADSAGEEGKYYTFKPEEILRILGEADGKRFNAQFDISERGNFHGANIPNLLNRNEIGTMDQSMLEQLRQYRKERMPLRTDDKILTAWNAITIAALCMLYRVTRKQPYLDAALRAQIFIEEKLRDGDTLITARRGELRGAKSFLDDYAWYAAALIELYASTLEQRYLNTAEQIFQTAHTKFADAQNGGYFQRAATDTELFLNPKEDYDGAIPSGNAVMAYVAVRLSQLAEKETFREIAQKQLQYLSAQAADYPAGRSFFLLTKLLDEHPPMQVCIIKEKEQPLPAKTTKLFLANVTVSQPSDEYPLLNRAVTYYICHDHACLPPTNSLENTD